MQSTDEKARMLFSKGPCAPAKMPSTPAIMEVIKDLDTATERMSSLISRLGVMQENVWGPIPVDPAESLIAQNAHAGRLRAAVDTLHNQLAQAESFIAQLERFI